MELEEQLGDEARLALRVGRQVYFPHTYVSVHAPSDDMPAVRVDCQCRNTTAVHILDAVHRLTRLRVKRTQDTIVPACDIKALMNKAVQP